jgi:hypothetical protein
MPLSAYTHVATETATRFVVWSQRVDRAAAVQGKDTLTLHAQQLLRTHSLNDA